MTLTTDPRDTVGPVAVSLTDRVKRDALTGRIAEHTIRPEVDDPWTTVHARIFSVDGSYPVARIIPPTDERTSYPPDLIGRTVRLGSVVTLLDCPRCGYTAGHWSYCPRSFDVLVRDERLHALVVELMTEDLLAQYEADTRAGELGREIDARIPGATERTASYATGMHMSSVDIVVWAGAHWSHCLSVMLGMGE